MSEEYKTPDWYDESKLRRAYLGDGETGWVVVVEPDKCRLANTPLPRDDDVNLSWGDLVPFIANGSRGFPEIERKVLEKYDPEVDRIKEGEDGKKENAKESSNAEA